MSSKNFQLLSKAEYKSNHTPGELRESQIGEVRDYSEKKSIISYGFNFSTHLNWKKTELPEVLVYIQIFSFMYNVSRKGLRWYCICYLWLYIYTIYLFLFTQTADPISSEHFSRHTLYIKETFYYFNYISSLPTHASFIFKNGVFVLLWILEHHEFLIPAK